MKRITALSLVWIVLVPRAAGATGAYGQLRAAHSEVWSGNSAATAEGLWGGSNIFEGRLGKASTVVATGGESFSEAPRDEEWDTGRIVESKDSWARVIEPPAPVAYAAETVPNKGTAAAAKKDNWKADRGATMGALAGALVGALIGLAIGGPFGAMAGFVIGALAGAAGCHSGRRGARA